MPTSLHILVIEDDSNFSSAFSDLLTLALKGVELQIDIVTTIASASHCLSCPSPCYDVVFLDLTLPDSTGVHTIDHVTTSPSSPPVVVLTDVPASELANIALNHGVEEYLPKPVLSNCAHAPDVLRRIIMQAMHRHAGRQRALLSLVRLYGNVVSSPSIEEKDSPTK